MKQRDLMTPQAGSDRSHFIGSASFLLAASWWDCNVTVRVLHHWHFSQRHFTPTQWRDMSCLPGVLSSNISLMNWKWNLTPGDIHYKTSAECRQIISIFPRFQSKSVNCAMMLQKTWLCKQIRCIKGQNWSQMTFVSCQTFNVNIEMGTTYHSLKSSSTRCFKK